jgi:hypothetical protein
MSNVAYRFIGQCYKTEIRQPEPDTAIPPVTWWHKTKSGKWRNMTTRQFENTPGGTCEYDAKNRHVGVSSARARLVIVGALFSPVLRAGVRGYRLRVLRVSPIYTLWSPPINIK